MPTPHILKELNSGKYFLTFTVKQWIYVFDRYDRWSIIANSLKYLQTEKQLKIYAFVFMLNHIHLIIESPDCIAFIRDFKKFTSKRLKENMLLSEPKLLTLFKNDKLVYKFWQNGNMPKWIESEYYYLQKKTYIENNPVKKKYVMIPEHWYWSSANSKCELKIDDI